MSFHDILPIFGGQDHGHNITAPTAQTAPDSDAQRRIVTLTDKGEHAAQSPSRTPRHPAPCPHPAISATRCRPAAYHSVPPGLTARTGAAPMFTPCQPKTFSSPADPNDAVA